MSLRERLESLRSAPARPILPQSSAPLPYLTALKNAKGLTYYNDKIYIDYHGQIDLKNFPNFSADTIEFLS
ncbi:MAG TPA: hypothetical protein VJ521_11055, partial [Acidobacteriota bacterium]|nr:hypothetical protein [Acidobacteriota bacterium]